MTGSGEAGNTLYALSSIVSMMFLSLQTRRRICWRISAGRLRKAMVFLVVDMAVLLEVAILSVA